MRSFMPPLPAPSLGWLKLAAILPIFLSGFWLQKLGVGLFHPVLVPGVQPVMEQKGSVSRSSRAVLPKPAAKGLSDSTLRQLRVERVLVALDRLAEVSLRMEPARAQILEPVILDIAEQVLDLKTDEDLERIETRVHHLVKALDRMVEPEMSL